MAQLPPFIPTKGPPRADPRPLNYRAALLSRGLNVTWEQSAVCPCGRSAGAVATGFGFTPAASLQTTGESRADCEVCKGSGYLYHSPTPTKLLVNGRSSDPRRFDAQGEMGHGMVSMSFLPENPPSFMDRVALTDSVMVYRQITTRAATVDAMRYPVVPRDLTLAAEVKTMGVLYAHKASAAGVAVAAGVLVEGVDFVVASGKIDWSLGVTLGTAPAVGDRYAMSFFAHPRYVVTSVPFSQRDTWIRHKSPTDVYAELPIRTSARLEYLGGVISG